MHIGKSPSIYGADISARLDSDRSELIQLNLVTDQYFNSFESVPIPPETIRP